MIRFQRIAALGKEARVFFQIDGTARAFCVAASHRMGCVILSFYRVSVLIVRFLSVVQSIKSHNSQILALG